MFRVPSPASAARPSTSVSIGSAPRVAGRWGVVLTSLLLGLFLGILGATPAAAHDVLEGSSPQDGSTVATVPTSVTLTFNEEVQNFSPVIQVTGPDGTDWADGDPTVSGVDVSVPVKAGAPAGAYTVAYRIVSDDGHPVTGTFTFTAEAAAAGAAPVVTTTETSAPATSAATSSGPGGTTASSSTPSSSSAPVTSSATTTTAPSSALVSPAANTTDSGSGVSGWLIAIIVLVVAAGGAVVAVLVRRARGGSSPA